MISFDQILNEIGENPVYSKLIISEIIDHLIFQVYICDHINAMHTNSITKRFPYISPKFYKNSKEKEISSIFLNILLKLDYCEYRVLPKESFEFFPEKVFSLRREWNVFNLPEYTEEQRADKAAYYLTTRK